MRKGKREVISVEEDAQVPDKYGLERFMEEVNILELEGYYFCPNKNEAGKTSKRTITLDELADKPVTITLSDYGRPGERAYKLLQAAFFKLTQERYDTAESGVRRNILGRCGNALAGIGNPG
jgi:hypothetical protein